AAPGRSARMKALLIALIPLALSAGGAHAQEHVHGAAQADPHTGHTMGTSASGPPDVPTSADDPGRPRRPPRLGPRALVPPTPPTPCGARL
ncbi:MAG: hypothetical protein Q8R71_14280, partial [Phenylobacterium sp.]|nr:hypothetical protein [Phenylobacterium sp.]